MVDKKTDTVQGRIELDLKVLLKERNLEVLNEEYALSGASGGLSVLKLNLSLKVGGAGRVRGSEVLQSFRIKRSGESLNLFLARFT